MQTNPMNGINELLHCMQLKMLHFIKDKTQEPVPPTQPNPTLIFCFKWNVQTKEELPHPMGWRENEPTMRKIRTKYINYYLVPFQFFLSFRTWSITTKTPIKFKTFLISLESTSPLLFCNQFDFQWKIGGTIFSVELVMELSFPHAVFLSFFLFHNWYQNDLLKIYK